MDQKINLHFSDTLSLSSSLAKAKDNLVHGQVIGWDKSQRILPSTGGDRSG